MRTQREGVCSKKISKYLSVHATSNPVQQHIDKGLAARLPVSAVLHTTPQVHFALDSREGHRTIEMALRHHFEGFFVEHLHPFAKRNRHQFFCPYSTNITFTI